MRTIQRDVAHRELVTKHKNLRWVTENGLVSVRKTSGKYVVRLEDFYYGKTTITTFATLAGALVCAENLKEMYL